MPTAQIWAYQSRNILVQQEEHLIEVIEVAMEHNVAKGRHGSTCKIQKGPFQALQSMMKVET
jgi:hypothetical protein